MDKFLASVDSELWALLSAREQQAASLHVGIIDGGPPRWLSKCGYVRAIFQPLPPTIASTSPLLLAPCLLAWVASYTFRPDTYTYACLFSFFPSLFFLYFLFCSNPRASRQENVPTPFVIPQLLSLGGFYSKEGPLREREYGQFSNVIDDVRGWDIPRKGAVLRGSAVPEKRSIKGPNYP